MRVYIVRATMERARRMRDALAGRHRVVGCTDSAGAHLAALRSSGADAFVLDCAMPWRDGVRLAAELAPRPCVLISPGGALEPRLEHARWIASEEQALDALRGMARQRLPEGAIHDELLRLGFKPHTRGTRQLEAALDIALRDEDTLADVRGRIYAPIAARMGCSAGSVERNIRYAIEGAWVRGDLNALQARFGYTIAAEKGKPTNRAFLAQMCEHIRLHRA